MKPAFVALTAEGLSRARRAAAAVGGEAHVLEAARGVPFSHREKVAAEQPDEGLEDRSGGPVDQRRAPSPVAFGDTLSPRERVGVSPSTSDHVFTDTAAHLRSLFSAGQPIVGVCAAGILIRVLAPLLSDKRDEPPVIAMSEDGASIVPLLGGHHGANALAQKLADVLGGHAAITTAGDNRFGVALDVPPPGWTLANPQDAKRVMAALLGGASARLEGRADWLTASRIPFSGNGDVQLTATTRTHDATSGGEPPLQLSLVYHPRKLAVGIGCERGADPDEAIALVERTLREAGLVREAVAIVVSIDLKADEPAILEAAKHLGVPARFFNAAALEAETPRLKNPSETVFREVGCHGVAEGAALASVGAEGTLVVAKRKSSRVTCAVTEAPEIISVARTGRARGRLAIVGIGPGSPDWLTPEAKRLLETSDAAIGYSLYLDLVAPLIARAERIDSTLGSEETRARRALELAGEGRNVALVSSGDAGIYAMASLVFELLDGEGRTFSHREKVAAEQPDEGFGQRLEVLTDQCRTPSPVAFGDTLSPRERVGAVLPAGAYRAEIVVAPGISAMQAAAARAGAPLGHDFCAISLSDLLTPWETIEARIRAAAEGDFVIAFYNPVSERRRTQLAEAKQILLEHRSPDTPVVLARNLGRDGESVTTIRLADLSVEDVDMLTLVLVGSSTTRQVKAGGQTYAYTPRGYAKKRGPSPPLRGRDGEGGETPRRALHASALPDPPPQGGRECVVHFIGAGPGAPDLITLRGLRLIERCPVCLYAGSLVPKEIVAAAPRDARVLDTASMTLDEIVTEIDAAVRDGKEVARVHSGDPSIYGAIAEQMRRLDALGISYDVTPGVPAFAAAAAALARELTIPGVSQTVILTRTAMKSSAMPDGEDLATLARSRATLAIHLSVRNLLKVERELSPICGADCPVIVAYRVGWPDETFIHGTLANIREKMRAAKITRTALILVGRALADSDFRDSALYDAGHAHVLRPKRKAAS